MPKAGRDVHLQICDQSKKIKRSLALKILLYLGRPWQSGLSRNFRTSGWPAFYRFKMYPIFTRLKTLVRFTSFNFCLDSLDFHPTTTDYRQPFWQLQFLCMVINHLFWVLDWSHWPSESDLKMAEICKNQDQCAPGRPWQLHLCVAITNLFWVFGIDHNYGIVQVEHV